MQTRAVDLPHGITLSCRVVGQPHRPRVMFLHGFPEAAFAWDGVLSLLAPRIHGLAPNLRGFSPSSSPPKVDSYRAKYLMADIEALVQLWGGPLDLLVAHDWGGAIAWNLAAQKPALMKHLLIINSPHPATFLRELLCSPAQQQASAYMNFLCRPDAEALLSEDDYARLWRFLGPKDLLGWLDEGLRARYREVWSAGLTGGLNLYRASPLRPPVGPDSPIHSLRLPDELVTIKVPTTVIWGERDTALLPGLLDGLEQWVPELTVVRLPEASHWVVHEAPMRVVSQIEHILGGPLMAKD